MSDERFEVVISGVSGRFPECNDLITYKKMLYNKENVITVDNRKWPINYKYKFGEDVVPPGTGKYDNVSKFDTRVFAINPALAECTDVINRQVMEPSYEAILDAGINPALLMGANVGCYMACGMNEAENIKTYTSQGGKLYLVGSSKSMKSNRISFALNLTGPSFTFHTSILGGLEALSAAYESVSRGQVDAAVVGMASSIIDPKLSLAFVKMGYLSHDALCRSFDKDANGYGRSEASICIFVQRAQDAKRNYGTILFSDSHFQGLNEEPMFGFDDELVTEIIKNMYAKHPNINPLDVSFVEMDGCGVERLEVLESNVISEIYCKDRKDPLLIGSVKSHCGHTEASAGMMSLLKAIFALDTGYIAPNMHFSEPNPKIKPLVEGKLKVVVDSTKLPGSIVAVNVMGISGAVSHALIKQNPKTKTIDESDTLPRLIIICGRTEEGLKAVVENVEMMPLNTDMCYMVNDVFKTPTLTHMYRAYTILPAGAKPTNAVEPIGGENRPIWFVFSGMGSQWNGMGNGLLNIPVFANAIDRCDKVLRPKGIDIRKVLTSDDPELFNEIVNAFVGIIAVQVALVDVLKAIGIEPDGIIGHSLGENGCAYADGCLTLEQSVLASYARGIASTEVKTIKGMMAAIGKGYEQIKDELPEGIEVACHNSADSCTLTGPADIVNTFVEELQEKKIFAKAVNVSNMAYHSKHIAPAGPILLKRLKEVITEPNERSSKWISTSVPESDWDKPLAKTCSAEYLTNNLVSPVLFEEGCKHIPKNAVVIEIAPHGLLQAILKRSLDSTCTNIPLTLRSKDHDAVNYLLSGIGKMFIAGLQPDVNAIYPKVEYPVPRGTPSLANFATWERIEDWGFVEPLKDPPLSEELIEVRINKGSKWHYLKGHKIKGQNIMPPSVYMYLTWHMLSMLKDETLGTVNIIFEDVKIHKHLHISLEKHRFFTVMIQLGSGNFEVLLENERNPDNVKVIMTGRIEVPYDNLPKYVVDNESEKTAKYKITRDEFYKNLENAGYQLEDNFKEIQGLSFNETNCFGKVTWNENWVTFLDSVMKLWMHGEKNLRKELVFPSGFRSMAINTNVFKELKPGDEILFQKDPATKQLWCEGLELSEFDFGPSKLDIPGDDVNNIKLEPLEFVPYANPNLQTIAEFLNLCLQIAIESASLAIYETGAKIHIIDTASTTASLMKKIIKQNFDIKSQIIFSEAKDISTVLLSQKNHHVLIVDSFASADKIYKQLKCKLNNLFVLVFQPVNDSFKWENENLFVEITKEVFKEAIVHFYKKITDTYEQPPSVVVADNNWMLKCAPALKAYNAQPVVVLRNEIETQDLSIILSRRKQYSSARFLYILDEDAPNFSTDNPVYKNQIEKDLPVAIYKNGQWGSYRNLKMSSTEIFDEDSKIDIHDLKLKTVDIIYLTHDKTKIEKEDINAPQEYEYGIEFSGISNSGKRIMGLGYYNPLESLKEPDPLFTWQVPKSWSLEEAGTIPLYYAQAYYAIIISPLRYHSRSILINANLPFTEACLAVGFQAKKFEIYVTVDTDAEAEILKRKFPSLKEKHILHREDYKYELELKLVTGGDGIDILINTFKTNEHISAVLNCLKMFGHYIEVSDESNAENTKFGLYNFLKSISFVVIPNQISTLLNLPTEIKKTLHDYIENGLNEDALKPLSRIVFGVDENMQFYRNDYSENKKALYKCFSKDDIINENANANLKCDENRSFIIISGGKKSNLWFELVEWLIQKGAKKFIVALDNFSLGPKLSHQINRLLVQKKATIILTSSKKAETVQDAVNLIAEANNVAPLEAVFFVSLDPAAAIVHNIDVASKTCNPFYFVCLLSGGLKECERRKNNDLPAVLIHSEKTINKFSDILPRMESVFTKFSTSTSPTLYDLSEKSKKSGKEDSLSIRLSNYLPVDLEKLESIGYYSTSKPTFIQAQSASKRYEETKGIYPVFIIPRVDHSLLQPFLNTLFYPVFCASFTEESPSAQNVAAHLYKDLQRIQPKGPVTIIGETWSGPVALELASLVERNNRKVALFLIEGSPATWKKHIKTLGEINTPQFENNFLKQVLNFEPKIKAEFECQTPQACDDYLEKYISYLGCSSDAKENVKRAINGIRNRLYMTLKYTPQGELLKHLVLFKQRPSESSMDTYCLSNEVYLFEEENYDEYLKIQDIRTIINDQALFTWWRK